MAGTLAAPLVPSPAFAWASSSRSTVARARIATYERSAIRGMLEAMFDDLGGLADVVRPGDTVGIKINLTGGSYWANAYEASSGLPVGTTIWTHPEVLRATAELIRDAGAGHIYILEALYDPQSYFGFGYPEAVEETGASLVNLNQTAPFGSFTARPVGEKAHLYTSFTQNGILEEIDVLVSLAKSKEHVGAGITHGMKNLVGALPLLPQYTNGSGNRAAIHNNRSLDVNSYSNLCRIILDLNLASPIRLVVNDVIQTVSGGEGPWVSLTPVRFDTLIASKDPVAADAVATQSLGFDPTAPGLSSPFPRSINYLALADELGMGRHDPSAIDVIDTVMTNREEDGLPDGGSSVSAFPTPFVHGTTVLVTLRNGSTGRITVYDLSGRRVLDLFEGHFGRGTTRFEWDGRTGSGERVTPGVYLIVAETGGSRTARRVIAL